MAHEGLTPERWATFPLRTRLLHVGTELTRLEHWLERGDAAAAAGCAERARALLDLSVITARPGRERRELCRAREVLGGVEEASDPRREARLLRRALVGDI